MKNPLQNAFKLFLYDLPFLKYSHLKVSLKTRSFNRKIEKKQKNWDNSAKKNNRGNYYEKLGKLKKGKVFSNKIEVIV